MMIAPQPAARLHPGFLTAQVTRLSMLLWQKHPDGRRGGTSGVLGLRVKENCTLIGKWACWIWTPFFSFFSYHPLDCERERKASPIAFAVCRSWCLGNVLGEKAVASQDHTVSSLCFFVFSAGVCGSIPFAADGQVNAEPTREEREEKKRKEKKRQKRPYRDRSHETPAFYCSPTIILHFHPAAFPRLQLPSPNPNS